MRRAIFAGAVAALLLGGGVLLWRASRSAEGPATATPAPTIDDTGMDTPAPATVKPATVKPACAITPDYEMARRIANAWAETEPARLYEVTQAMVQRGQDVVPGLVALVERGNDFIRPDSGLRQWQCAAAVLSTIGDQRCTPALAVRLGDPEARDCDFVEALGRLRVRQAVPYLVRWLEEEKMWEINSQRYGAQANYMLETLEGITGRCFTGMIDPDERRRQHVERYTKKKQEILAAINEWWARGGQKEYELKPASGAAAIVKPATAKPATATPTATLKPWSQEEWESLLRAAQQRFAEVPPGQAIPVEVLTAPGALGDGFRHTSTNQYEYKTGGPKLWDLHFVGQGEVLEATGEKELHLTLFVLASASEAREYGLQRAFSGEAPPEYYLSQFKKTFDQKGYPGDFCFNSSNFSRRNVVADCSLEDETARLKVLSRVDEYLKKAQAGSPSATKAPPSPLSSPPGERIPTGPAYVLDPNRPDSKVEGYAPLATGGEGGEVIEVTSLCDAGPGTFREALDKAKALAGKPARIVFKVGGTIQVRSVLNLSASNVTVDGATAPAPGITLNGREIYKHNFDAQGFVSVPYKGKGKQKRGRGGRGGGGMHAFRGPMFTLSGAQNVVVRDVRFRDSPVHSFQIFRSERVLVDHISTTGCADGAFSVNAGCKNITLQWSLLAGNNLTFRCRGDRISVHHCLFTENRMRHPFCRIDGVRDLRNNVIQNWYLAGIQVEGDARINIVNNWFTGPVAAGKRADNAIYAGTGIYAAGNAGPKDFDPNSRSAVAQAWEEPPVTTLEAAAARKLVLQYAGARPRDALDAGYVDGTRKYVHIMKEEWTLPGPWWEREAPPPPPTYNPTDFGGEETETD